MILILTYTHTHTHKIPPVILGMLACTWQRRLHQQPQMSGLCRLVPFLPDWFRLSAYQSGKSAPSWLRRYSQVWHLHGNPRPHGPQLRLTAQIEVRISRNPSFYPSILPFIHPSFLFSIHPAVIGRSLVSYISTCSISLEQKIDRTNAAPCKTCNSSQTFKQWVSKPNPSE